MKYNYPLYHAFTTETLEDIVLSFSGHKCINPNEIQGPILKQALSDNK